MLAINSCIIIREFEAMIELTHFPTMYKIVFKINKKTIVWQRRSWKIIASARAQQRPVFIRVSKATVDATTNDVFSTPKAVFSIARDVYCDEWTRNRLQSQRLLNVVICQFQFQFKTFVLMRK